MQILSILYYEHEMYAEAVHRKCAELFLPQHFSSGQGGVHENCLMAPAGAGSAVVLGTTCSYLEDPDRMAGMK